MGNDKFTQYSCDNCRESSLRLSTSGIRQDEVPIQIGKCRIHVKYSKVNTPQKLRDYTIHLIRKYNLVYNSNDFTDVEKERLNVPGKGTISESYYTESQTDDSAHLDSRKRPKLKKQSEDHSDPGEDEPLL